MDMDIREAPPAVPSNGTNGNGNGNGHGGIAVPVVEALGTPEASNPVTAVVETTEAGGQSASADSESVGVPENEGETPKSDDEQLPRELGENDLVVFRPWRVGPVVAKIVSVDLAKALAERPGMRWSDRIRDAHGPAKQLLDSVGEKEVKIRLQNIVRSGEDGHRFTFAQAKVVVYKFLCRIAYAILPGVEPDLREWLVRRMQTLEEERGWFCPGAQYDDELAGYRRWQEDQQRRAAAEHRARETALGTEEMLDAMSLLGGEVAIRVSSAGASERQAICVGDRIAGIVKGLAIGLDKRDNRRYVAGILFKLESGLEAFVPISETGWDRTGGEREDEFAEVLKRNFPEGKSCQLEVVKVEPDKKKGGGLRIVTRILDVSEIVPNSEDRQSRPGLRLGEEVGGVVHWVGQDGIVVRLFAPNIELFAHVGDLAPDTALGDYRRGDKVEGVVIQGGQKPFAMKITVREDKGKGEQPLPEHIIHLELVEMVREYATAQGLDLGDERWSMLREYAAKAKLPEVLTAEEVEPARVFFGGLLKDVTDVPAEIVSAAAGAVTTRGAYREEQDAKTRRSDQSGQKEDGRPFCRNHDAPDGQRCDKRVANAGGLCDRCMGKMRRMTAKAPRPPKAKEKSGNCKSCVKEGGPCKKHRKQVTTA